MSAGKASGARWAFGVCALIAACYWFCLEFVFGGRFRPWLPNTDDYYLFMTPGDAFVSNILGQPRFVGFAVINVFNKLGLTGATSGIIALALLTLALVIAATREIVGARPPWTGVAAYLLAVFTSAHYFEGQVFDFFHTTALFFFGAVVCLWYRDTRRGRRRLGWYLVLIALCAASKETMIPGLALFFAFHGLVGDDPSRKRIARILFAYSILAAGGTVLHDTLLTRSAWVAMSPDPAGPYRISAARFGEILIRYVGGSARAPVMALVALAMLLQKDAKTGLLFLALGVSPYVPMALLPNHVFDFYAWMGLPLLCAPLLLVDPQRLARRVLPASGRITLTVGHLFSVAAFAALALNAGSGGEAVAGNPVVAATDYHERVLAGVETLKRRMTPSGHLLVLGLRGNHPFTRKGKRFIAQKLLASGGRITVATYGDPMGYAPKLYESAGSASSMAWVEQATALRLRETYDEVAVFGADGFLMDVVDKEKVANLAANAVPRGAGEAELQQLLLAGPAVSGAAQRFAQTTRRFSAIHCRGKVPCLVASSTVLVRSAGDDVEISALDGDPYVLLANFPLDKGKGCVVRVDLTAPAKTVLELYYTLENVPGPQYTAGRSVSAAIEAGRNVRILEIPVPGLTGRLRLDPGAVPGRYVIHAVEAAQ